MRLMQLNWRQRHHPARFPRAMRPGVRHRLPPGLAAGLEIGVIGDLRTSLRASWPGLSRLSTGFSASMLMSAQDESFGPQHFAAGRPFGPVPKPCRRGWPGHARRGDEGCDQQQSYMSPSLPCQNRKSALCCSAMGCGRTAVGNVDFCPASTTQGVNSKAEANFCLRLGSF